MIWVALENVMGGYKKQRVHMNLKIFHKSYRD